MIEINIINKIKNEVIIELLKEFDKLKLEYYASVKKNNYYDTIHITGGLFSIVNSCKTIFPSSSDLTVENMEKLTECIKFLHSILPKED